MSTLAEPGRPVVRRSAAEAPAIQIADISVCFEMPAERIPSFKEYVLRRLTGRIERRQLWALRDVSLEVGSGEVLGVVGRNGAGKSTLLKVISRVLHPNHGRLVMRGSVAPLLELGAGFHFDLTGRENVYLNAALLGQPIRVIEDHFEEVVDFSELREFIDFPIRNYSSGMLTRLGFSVATMIRPDILLIDEVLAVGDARFQEKCLERIYEFRSRGTTIVLVSHQIAQVEQHCDRALWIDHGRVAAFGDTAEVVAGYRQALDETPEAAL